jgi:predicted amidohydrolase YtcJ
MDHLTIPFLGPERAGWQYPFASLVRTGAVLAFGSDWGVSSPNPLEEIHVAVNRTGWPGYEYGGTEESATVPLIPSEAIDLPTAVAAFTIGSAYVNHLDELTGSIEVGKLADLVVLDRNIFERPVQEIHAARALLTLVEGERVHVADDL